MLQRTPKMPAPAGHAIVAVMRANTGSMPEGKLSRTMRPAVAEVMKAHTVLAAVACATVGDKGELIV